MAESFRAIDTKYRGFLFRSRLEARWAVFFDALGVGFRYEPEGFELHRLRYLPDFYMPSLGCWLEIKPEWPDETAQRKMALLTAYRNERVICLIGEPSPPDGAWTLETPHLAYLPQGPIGEDGRPEALPDQPYWWTQCETCRQVGLAWEGRADRLDCCGVGGRGSRAYRAPALLTAYGQARAARFNGHDPWTWKVEP